MKYQGTEISDMHDLVLMQIHRHFKEALAEREKAASHRKFDKNNPKNVGAFPPPNPAFLELKNELENEMKKRKLEIE